MRRHAGQHNKGTGQVLIEFALAAAGLVVLAFVTARVGHWLNESMVERNASFQATRVAAASTNPGVAFAGPSDIHLIGPGAQSTGGTGSPPPSTFSAGCPAAADALVAQAQGLRVQAEELLQQGVNWDLLVQEQISQLQNEADILIPFANDAWWDKERIEDLDGWIANVENQIMNLYIANQSLLQEFLDEYGIGSADELIDAWTVEFAELFDVEIKVLRMRVVIGVRDLHEGDVVFE